MVYEIKFLTFLQKYNIMQSIELIFCEFLYLLSIKTLFENYFSFLQGVILNTLFFSIIKSMEKAGKQMAKYSKLFSPSLKGVILNTLFFSID